MTSLSGISDPDMIELFEAVIEKLEAITDEEFLGIGFYPAYDGESHDSL